MRGNELIKKVETLGEGKGDRRPGRQEAGEGKSSNALFRRTEDHHSQPEGRIEDWHLPRGAQTARHQREGLEMTAMNSARRLANRMETLAYAVRLEPAKEGSYVVTCRDLPEVVTQGDDFEEALAQASDAMDEAFAARMDETCGTDPEN